MATQPYVCICGDISHIRTIPRVCYKGKLYLLKINLRNNHMRNMNDPIAITALS